MKLLGDQTTLVIAGAWNPAILNPHWIGRHILGFAAGKAFQVGMLMPVSGLNGPTRLTFEGISITSGPDALVFHLVPEDAEMVAKSFNVAKGILETLPHTPISAMGINFAYEVGPLEGNLKRTVEWADDIGEVIEDDPDARVVSRTWQLGIAAMGHLVNLSCQSNAESASIAVNHHYEVEGSAARAAEKLAVDGLFDKLLATTNKLVDRLVRGDTNEG